jgi:tetratricopeptide (TPR) repeat protein
VVDDVNDPQTLLQHAQRLEKAGRLAEAEAAYMQLLSRWPDLANTWYNLALLQRRAGRFDAALASYQQALDRGISEPEEVHLNRGVIYADCLRQDEAAERELRAALALNPRYAPALLNLANLREDLGRRAEAFALYEKILALEPRHHEALARYASLKSVRAPDDPLIARLSSAIKDPQASVAERASLAFALGKSLDGARAYDQAFGVYEVANRFSRLSAAGVTYDRGAHERFIDQLIASSAPRSNQASARPIFICGMFRSGSTLVEQVLSAHSRVTGGGELSLVPAMVRQDLAPFPASLASIAPQRLDALAARYLEELSRLFPRGDHVTDKRPDNFLYIGLIKSLLPNARIIHTTRHALDNCLSIYFLHLDHSMSYALDLGDIAHYYSQYRRLMAHWKTLYGNDIHDFDYDRFVRDPRPALERLLEFCGLEWEEACLSFQDAASAVKTASVWQVREPLYVRSSGRWRNYERQLAPLRAQLREHCPDLDLS